MMKVKDAMTYHRECIGPLDSAAAAENIMRTTNVQTLSVSDHAKVIGTLTAQQIAERTPDMGKSPQRTRVDEIMEHCSIVVHENDDLGAVRDQMTRAGIITVPVLDQNERIIGTLNAS